MARHMKYVRDVLYESNYRNLDAKTLEKVMPDLLRRVIESENINEDSKKRVVSLFKLVTEHIYTSTTTHNNED